jgi:hypothetical protein
VTAVDVPAFRFLMADGEGDPDSDGYAEAVQALFSVSCASKFAIKRGPQAIDYAVMVHAFIDERGALRGKHHEIYLSDIRRAAPEKWRTVTRQPMQP